MAQYYPRLLVLCLHLLTSAIYSAQPCLTLEEKIGQLLLVSFEGTDAQLAAPLLEQAHVGGFIYFTRLNGLTSAQQIRNLSNTLQELNRKIGNKEPLFIAVDQEGGSVNRIKADVTLMPAPAILGSLDTEAITYSCFYTLALQLRDLGITMNMAPVADVASCLQTSPIGTRSFGSNPTLVARHVATAVRAQKAAGICPVIKHFPGHGNATGDSHTELPTVHTSYHALTQTELVPFARTIADTPALMTAHLAVPALDQINQTTYSSATITTLLREQWKFQGIVMTDSIFMDGAGASLSLSERAIRALQAGHDIILVGGLRLHDNGSHYTASIPEIITLHHDLVEAVKTGRISIQQIDTSVQRIRQCKQQFSQPRFHTSCALQIPASPAQFWTRINPKTGENVAPSLLVLHYTELPLDHTLRLCAGHDDTRPVAAHYTVSEGGIIFQHIDEAYAGRHTGDSRWRDYPYRLGNQWGLNLVSIGVEHVNLGFRHTPEQPAGTIIAGSDREWYSFPEEEIQASIALCQNIIHAHHISARNVVGHSDIAPKRKVDPGPLFPWKRFAEAGIGAWPPERVDGQLPCFAQAQQDGTLATWIITHLHFWGYPLPDATATKTDIISAFQMHFRQNNISGDPDFETAHLLHNLIYSYIVIEETQHACPCRPTQKIAAT